MIQISHFKAVHRFVHVTQKLMTFSLMKRIMSTLQYPCIIWLNMVIIIQIHQEAFGS